MLIQGWSAEKTIRCGKMDFSGEELGSRPGFDRQYMIGFENNKKGEDYSLVQS